MAHRYLLSEIPNDEEGERFVKEFRKYLNKEGWNARIRGQHLKPGLNWRHYPDGQPIECSTHLRVYVDRRKSK
jgi:hypothetical protein